MEAKPATAEEGNVSDEYEKVEKQNCEGSPTYDHSSCCMGKSKEELDGKCSEMLSSDDKSETSTINGSISNQQASTCGDSDKRSVSENTKDKNCKYESADPSIISDISSSKSCTVNDIAGDDSCHKASSTKDDLCCKVSPSDDSCCKASPTDESCCKSVDDEVKPINKGLAYIESAIKEWSPPHTGSRPEPLNAATTCKPTAGTGSCLTDKRNQCYDAVRSPPTFVTTPPTPLTSTTNKDGQLSFDDIIKNLEERIKVLLLTEDFSVRGPSRSAFKYIQRQTRHSNDNVLKQHIVDKIVQFGIAHVFLKVWKYIQDFAPQGDFLQLPEESLAYKNLDVTLSIVWNCTDKSASLCECLARCGVINLLVTELQNKELVMLEIPEEPAKLTSKENCALYLIKAYLGILHNIVRLCVDSSSLFRSANAVTILRAYLMARQGLVYAKAYLILAYIIDERENELVNASDEHVTFMVEILKDAVFSEGHFSVLHGFTAAEIACGLNHLAVNDSNKVKIVRSGALISYTALLQSASVQEQMLAASGLWILAFHDDNKMIIRRHPECLEGLTALSEESPHEEVRRSARGALWVLNSLQADTGSSTPRTLSRQVSENAEFASVPHIMLSYNHSTQPTMIKICELLRQRGYKVWMDVDHMFGSTLESMALAVEQSTVVLIGMCQRYKDSASCRTEAEYTYQLRKDIIPLLLETGYVPDGWLGVLVGTRLYQDFSSDSVIPTSVDRLVRELGKRGRIRPDPLSASSSYSSSRSTSCALGTSGRSTGLSGQLSVRSGSVSATGRRSHTSSEGESSHSHGMLSLSGSSSSLHSSIVRVTPASTPPPTSGSTATALPPSSPQPVVSVRGWRGEQVQHWLVDNNLGSLVDRFTEFDGALLLEYQRMHTTAPEFFYHSLERHLSMSLPAMLRFTKALQGIG